MNTTSLTTPTRLDPSAADARFSLLRMAVGDLVLAVAIDDVREILQVARLTPLPRTPLPFDERLALIDDVIKPGYAVLIG